MKKSTEPARYDKYDPNLSSDEDVEFEQIEPLSGTLKKCKEKRGSIAFKMQMMNGDATQSTNKICFY